MLKLRKRKQAGMTVAEMEQAWARQNAFMKEILASIAGTPPQPLRFPAAVADHPAFTRRFNATLAAYGMAATRDKHGHGPIRGLA